MTAWEKRMAAIVIVQWIAIACLCMALSEERDALPPRSDITVKQGQVYVPPMLASALTLEAMPVRGWKTARK